MSRIFRSTTALAASLSLIAPSFAMAETPLAQAEFEQLRAQTTQGQPHLAAALAAEIAGGLTADDLGCMDDSPRPCADGVALKTPSGMAVRISESGEIALAPRSEQNEQVANAIAGAALAAAGAAPAADAAVAAAGPSESELAEALAADEPEVAEEPAPEAEVTAQADAPVILPQTAAEPAAEAPAEPAAEPAPEVAAEAPAPVAAPEAPPAPVAPETAAAPEPQPEAPAETPEPPVQAADAPAPEPVAPAPEVAASTDSPAAPVAAEAGESEGDLAAALAAEAAADAPAAEPAPAPPAEQQADAAPAPEAGTSEDDLAAALAAAQGEAPSEQTAAPAPVTPDAAAQALAASTGQEAAPQPVEVSPEEQSALADALASVAAAATPAEPETDVEPQTEAAPQPQEQEQASGQPAAVAPAPDAAATAGAEAAGDDGDAAALAAAAALAPVAAALLAPAQLSDSATSVVVTPESARSSAEDFGTSIAQAVAAAQNAPVVTGEQAAAIPVGPSGEPVANDPVVVTPAAPSGETPTTVAEDDDDDNTLRNLLIAGLGAYAVGTILQNQNRVALNTGDRVVTVAPDGSQQVLRNDDALLLTPGAQVTTENFSDGSSRTIVSREDGSRVVTIRDAQLRVLRRTLIQPNGSVVDLINEAAPVAPVEVAALPPAARPVTVSPSASTEELAAALRQEAAVSRSFSLTQIRNIAQVRNLVAPISIDSITFDTGSAAIRPDQARQLAALGNTIAGMIETNPAEVFLIEGYTDSVGSETFNLALSDRRAESLALALTEYFDVPPENLVVQGYGERFLAVPQEGDIRENRRVAVRRITDLLN